VNAQKKLLAYLEGNLTPEQRLRVHRQLQQSAQLRAELTRLSQQKRELEDEMPLFGMERGTITQLQGLLPGILQEAQQSKTKKTATPDSKRLQLLLVTCLMTVAVMIPILLATNPSAYAAVSPLQNVPRATDTPVNRRDATEESIAGVFNRRSDSGVVLVAQQTMPAVGAASPVPAPGATLDASPAARMQP
jgi:anti-sigma factor RsiW